MREKITLLPDGSRFLEVRQRIAWFREKYPNGRIVTEIIAVKADWVIMKATVYADLIGDAVAEGHACRKRTADAPNHIGAAETAAIGRALSDLGFDVATIDVEDAIVTRRGDVKAAKADLAILIPDADGVEKRYLPAKIRIAMWRRKNPNGHIKYDLRGFDGTSAIVVASVIDAAGNVVATGSARRSAREGDIGYFLGTAETAAAGRAMAYLGYDLPPDSGNTSDIGSEEPIGAHPRRGIVEAPEGVESDWDYDAPAEAASVAADETVDLAAGGTDEVKFEDWVQTMNPPEEPYKADPESSATIFPFGPNAGRTIGEIAAAEGGREYLAKIAEVYHGDDVLTRKIREVLDGEAP